MDGIRMEAGGSLFYPHTASIIVPESQKTDVSASI